MNPRTRAQQLLKWHQLINENRDDLAKILVYETGKPLAEAYGEIDYANGRSNPFRFRIQLTGFG